MSPRLFLFFCPLPCCPACPAQPGGSQVKERPFTELIPALPACLFVAINSNLRAPEDLARVNVQSSLNVNYWCQTLNCTETRLRNAVLAVGPLAVDVQAYLAR